MAIIPKDEKGIALILTITLIGLIVILTLQFGKSIRTGLYETAGFADGIKLEAIAKSGFNCALAVLYKDDSNGDSLQDDWASLGEYSSYSANLFDNGGRFETTVTDLAGKIQLNRLFNQNGDYILKQKEMLKRLLGMTAFNLESDNIEEILDAIKDWVDKDNEVTGFGGAEDSYYQSLDRPYSCRNAPFESVDELLLVKGITPKLFYGTDEVPGISAYLTVQGDGKININTADPMVIESLSDDLDSTMVEEIVAYRNDEKNDLSKPDWYKSAIGTNENYIDPALITIKSSYFQIRSRGIKDSLSKEINAIVKRNDKKLTILSWEML